MFSFYFWNPSLSRKNAKNQYALLPGISVTVLASHFGSVIDNSGPHGGPAILTYPPMVFYILLGPQVLWNDLRGIVIKQRY
jgi:hypothetical protein